MGITIVFRGRLNEACRADDFLREIRSLAETARWPCDDVRSFLDKVELPHLGLVGLTLHPHPECEPLHFHLDPDGRLVNYQYYCWMHDDEQRRRLLAFMEANQRALAALGLSPGQRGPVEIPDLTTVELSDGVTYNWIKTQFAPPEIHVAICELFAYIKQLYIADLAVTDDSGYFEHRDRTTLEQERDLVNYYIGALSSPSPVSGSGFETVEALVDEIARRLEAARGRLN